MNTECCICFEIVRSTENQKPFATRCGHIFHENCIKNCLETQTSDRKCPQCNQKIHSFHLIRLFFNQPESSIEAKEELIARLKAQLNELQEKSQLQNDLIASLKRQLNVYERQKSTTKSSQSATSGANSQKLVLTRGQIAPSKLKVDNKVNLDTAGSTFSFSSTTGFPSQSEEDATAHSIFTFKGINPTGMSSSAASSSSTGTTFGSSNVFGNWPKGVHSKFSFGSKNPFESQGSAPSPDLSKFESISLELKRDLYKKIGCLIFGENSPDVSKPLETESSDSTFTGLPSSQNTQPTNGFLGSSSLMLQHPKPNSPVLRTSSSFQLDSSVTEENKLQSDNASNAPASKLSKIPSFGGGAIFNSGSKLTLFAPSKFSFTSSNQTTTTAADTPFNMSNTSTSGRNLFMPQETQLAASSFGCRPKSTSFTATRTRSSDSSNFGDSPEKSTALTYSNKPFYFGNASMSPNSPPLAKSTHRLSLGNIPTNLNENLNRFLSSMPKMSFSSGAEAIPGGSAEVTPEKIPGNNSNPLSVEKVVDCRMRNRKLEYLVKWKGRSDDNNTWVARTDSKYFHVIAAFENELAKSVESDENIADVEAEPEQ